MLADALAGVEGNTPISAECAEQLLELELFCRSDPRFEWVLELRGDLRLILESRKVHHDLELAKALVGELTEWRETNRPHLITPDEIMDELTQNKAFWFGTDRAGHPTLWFQMAKHRSQTPERAVMLVLYLLRAGLLRMQFPVEKFSIALDLTDASIDAGFIRKLVSAMGSAFPGRSQRILVINVGWVVRSIWAVVRPLLPTRTVERIVFVRRDVPEHLSTFFEPRSLPALALGGERDVDYVYRGSVFADEDPVAAPELQESKRVSRGAAPAAERFKLGGIAATSPSASSETGSEFWSSEGDQARGAQAKAALTPRVARESGAHANSRSASRRLVFDHPEAGAADESSDSSVDARQDAAAAAADHESSETAANNALLQLTMQAAATTARVDALDAHMRVLEIRLRALRQRAERKRSCCVVQ